VTRSPGIPNQLQRLTAVSRVLGESASVQEALDTAVTCAAEVLGGERAVLVLKDPDDGLLHVQAAHGLKPGSADRVAEPLSERLVRRLETLLDASAGHGFIGVPIISGGAVVGILAAVRATDIRSSADPRDEWLLSALSDQVAVALARGTDGGGRGPRLRGDDALTMVAHDLRSPLSALKGYVHLLQQGRFGALTDSQETVVDRLGGIADHINALAQNIQDFGEIADGTLELDTRPVQLWPIVEEARTMIGLRVREQRLTVRVSVPGVLKVVAAPDRLRQVLIQLLDNAIKHAPEDSTVEVRAEETTAGRVAVLVSDEGPGVPPGSEETIFEAYRQLHGQRECAGLGLGLAIGRALIERMGGKLTVLQDSRRGATFRVELARRGEPHSPASDS